MANQPCIYLGMGAAMNNASPNKSLSKEFLENYLLTQDGLVTNERRCSLRGCG